MQHADGRQFGIRLFDYNSKAAVSDFSAYLLVCCVHPVSVFRVLHFTAILNIRL